MATEKCNSLSYFTQCSDQEHLAKILKKKKHNVVMNMFLKYMADCHFSIFYWHNGSHINSYHSNGTADISQTILHILLKLKTYIWTIKSLISGRLHWKNRNFSPLWQPSWTLSWIFKVAQGWQVHTHLDIIRYTPRVNNQQRKKTLSEMLGLGENLAFGCWTKGF